MRIGSQGLSDHRACAVDHRTSRWTVAPRTVVPSHRTFLPFLRPGVDENIDHHVRAHVNEKERGTCESIFEFERQHW
jgi:hypothetical protein